MPTKPDNAYREYYIQLLLLRRSLLYKSVLCTVGQPQPNVKIERFFQTHEKHRQRFGTLDEFFTFYNEERPSMLLRQGNTMPRASNIMDWAVILNNILGEQAVAVKVNVIKAAEAGDDVCTGVDADRALQHTADH